LLYGISSGGNINACSYDENFKKESARHAIISYINYHRLFIMQVTSEMSGIQNQL
jgi:hypothetical protein